MPYPRVGSLTSTWVTAPTRRPFCTMGEPLMPCTMPPDAASRSGSVILMSRLRLGSLLVMFTRSMRTV